MVRKWLWYCGCIEIVVQDMCGVQSPGYYFCNKRKGHGGKHIACIVGEKHWVEVWD